MWRVIELRLRHRLPIFALLYASCWLLAATIAVFDPTMRTPERFVVLAGAFSLALAFFAHTAVLSYDVRESRASLHFALPIPQGQLLNQRVIEPVLPTVAVGLVTPALAATARQLAGGHAEKQMLVFWLALTSMMLAFGQAHLFADEIQRHVRWRRMVVVAVAVGIGVCGAAFGFVLGAFARAGEQELPTIVALLGQSEVIFSFLAITLLLAGLNRLLLARRQNFID